jgi:hypothetical protein
MFHYLLQDSGGELAEVKGGIQECLIQGLNTGKWSLHVRGSSVDYPSLCLPTIWLFFLTASVPWRKRCWSACWNHQGKLLSLSQLNSCISLLYLQFNPIISQVLGTPTREEIKCMNPNYTEFKFPQIKAHSWHKVGILYWILCPLFLSLTSTKVDIFHWCLSMLDIP